MASAKAPTSYHDLSIGIRQALLELPDELVKTSKRLAISTTLATLGPDLGILLSSKLRAAPDQMLPRLLTLVAISKDAKLAPFVEKLLDHKDGDIRLKAIATLGHLHAERMVPRLTEIALHKTLLKTKKLKEQRIAAVKALAEIGTDEARGALQQVANKGPRELKKLCQELL